MTKRELPVTDYAILGTLPLDQRRIHLRRFCAHLPKESYAPTRELAGRCYEEVTDLFVLPPLNLAALEEIVRSEANVYSLDMNLRTIRALWAAARAQDVRVRRHYPAPLKMSPTRALKGLVRYVASDADGAFFPVIEPRVPKFNEHAWGFLSSFHREQCCHGEFKDARIAILRFPKIDRLGNRKVELIWDSELPSFTKAEMDGMIAEVDALHDLVHPIVMAEKARKQKERDRAGDQPGLFDGFDDTH